MRGICYTLPEIEGSPTVGKHMKILVADDSKTNLALITAALTKLGHQVIPAASGRIAIEHFRDHRPDLIILDVVMADIDGFECAKQIRAINCKDWIPIIFLSSSVDDESIAKGINAGGDDYLSKPFSNVTLAAKIKAMQRISDMRKELYNMTQKLILLSSTDTLTGLYNRLQFDKIMNEKIAHANRHLCIFALLFLDLDFFKKVNDTLGHHAGDSLLKKVALRLKSSVRMNDFIARMGGDEFAIILEELLDISEAKAIAEKIIKSLSSPYRIGKELVQIGCSIGIAYYPNDGHNKIILAQNADIAMYRSKDLGRNTYQCFGELET